MDVALAERMGLPIEYASNGNWGKYLGPGEVINEYVGGIHGPVTFQLSPDVSIDLPCLRLIRHKFPLFLIGTDVLRV